MPDQFICEDCTNGRFLRYGEIVWARLPPNMHSSSRYRSVKHLNGHSALFRSQDYASLTAGMYWWPAEVVHPRHLPSLNHDLETNNHLISARSIIRQQYYGGEDEHVVGLFPIRLFGLTRRCSKSIARPVFLWTTRARLFFYEEGDDKREQSSR